ncbi:Dbl homology domain-containing protein, partial [Phycomyces blakesleeanus]
MCSNVSSGRISVYTLPTSIEDEVAARKEFLRRPTDDTHESLYKGFKPNGFGTPCSYKTWKESINPKQYQQLSRLSPKQQKYQELIHEVILTECKYIEDLELVQKIFIKDAVEWEGLPSTLLKIFNSTNKIVELHKSILKVDSMEIYSTYFVNFEQANHVITNALKSKSDLLGTYIRNRASWSECRNLPLQSFMLLPIQRIMKYPLFFRQLRECLEPEDSIFWEMQQLETKMDKAIRLIENDKAEAERYHRLEDLTTRISGLDTSINLLKPGRRLIHEGPLDLLPCSQNPLTDSSNDIYGSSISAQSITSPHPNVLKRRNSTFSIKEKKKHLYVFLFDDLIICTKIRSTSREIDENIIAKVESYHGPNPEALFRVVQEPGQLTLVDRTVTRKVARQDKTGRLLGSLRKPTAAAFNAMYNSTTEYEEHPLQFMCSIASKRIVVYHFEAPTAHDKDVWCTRLQEASKLHVR